MRVLIYRITSSFSGTITSHILCLKVKSMQNNFEGILPLSLCITALSICLVFALSCAKCWLLPEEKYGTRQSMILFVMAHTIFFKVFSRRSIKKCNASYYAQRLTIKIKHNTLFQTKTWGALYLHNEKLTELFWKFKDSGTTGMQEGKELSNRDKSLWVNPFSASTCAESLISCVLVRNLQGVNLSSGQPSQYQR